MACSNDKVSVLCVFWCIPDAKLPNLLPYLAHQEVRPWLMQNQPHYMHRSQYLCDKTKSTQWLKKQQKQKCRGKGSHFKEYHIGYTRNLDIFLCDPKRLSLSCFSILVVLKPYRISDNICVKFGQTKPYLRKSKQKS